jgi:hypothetical protein
VYQAEKFLESAAAMVAGDIVVELKPQHLDTVLIGTVGREKVKPDSMTAFCQRHLHDPTLMDDIIVEDKVKDTGASVGSQERPQKIEEKPASLLISLDPDDVAGPVVESSRKVGLPVLPRSEDSALPARKHPVGADARIQVDVDFIDIEALLRRTQPGENLPDLPQTPFPFRFSPGTQDDGSSTTPMGAQLIQGATDGGPAQRDPRTSQDFKHQQLLAPSASGPATFPGRYFEKLLQRAEDDIIKLPGAVLFSSVYEPCQAVFEIPVGCPADMSAGNHQMTFDDHRGLTFGRQSNDQKSQGIARILGLSCSTDQISTHLAGK